MEFPLLWVEPAASCPVNEKNLAPSSFLPTHQEFLGIIKTLLELSLIEAEQLQHFQQRIKICKNQISNPNWSPKSLFLGEQETPVALRIQPPDPAHLRWDSVPTHSCQIPLGMAFETLLWDWQVSQSIYEGPASS